MNTSNRAPPPRPASERLQEIRERSSSSRQSVEIATTGLSNLALKQAEAARQAEQARIAIAETAAAKAESLKQRAIKDITAMRTEKDKFQRKARLVQEENERLLKQLSVRQLSKRSIWIRALAVAGAALVATLALVLATSQPEFPLTPTTPPEPPPVKQEIPAAQEPPSLIIRSELIEKNVLLIVYRLPDNSDIDGNHFYLGHVRPLKGGTIQALRLRIEKGEGHADFTVDLEVPLEYDLKQLHFRLRNAAAK